MELVLERWYYRAAISSAVGSDTSALRQSLRVGADVANILTALRLVGLPESATFLRQRYNADDATPLFIGPGSVSFALLADAAGQQSMRRAVQKLSGTSFGALLEGALGHYSATERLSEFEDALVHHQLKHARSLLVSDPLGIGVMIGYVALKTTEINNLHRIALGLDLNEKPDQIRSELITVDE
jgi:vacuolar-type H+-ATPase subunit C/Vma6